MVIIMSKWIWYYGDFELRHSLLLHTRRDEYDYMFPPFWRIDDCRHNVRFKKEIMLEKRSKITVYARGTGHVELDGKRFPLGSELVLESGAHTVIIYVMNAEGLPCAYVDGDIESDETWLASDYGKWTGAGCSDAYTDSCDDPNIFKFSYEQIEPVSETAVNGGVLYDFGRETFAKLVFDDVNGETHIYYGESAAEATDTDNAYLRECVTEPCELKSRAFRYLYITGGGTHSFKAYYEYLPLEYKGSFRCSDELINKIWSVAAYTFHLNSREFFLDGIKRDRWVWSGDAYQSHLINRYLFNDAEISKRTILALRGNDPIEKHINTIVDYSFYWIISIYDYYMTTGDGDFIKRIYPKMESLMDFCISRLDKNGFVSKVDDDWIFIDWAEIDKMGAVCAEQMLYLKSLETMAMCGELLNIDNTEYKTVAEEFKRKINEYFWNEEKGAFIDSFESGKNNVSRHANIFALLFGYADEKQRESIIKNVLQNENVPGIKTPYFKFYELEAMCQTGDIKAITDQIRSYWGGMLSEDATSFWEEYDPKVTGNEKYKMYGDKFGKSLCHAWGASPVYLMGRYYMGVTPTSAGYETFEVKPDHGGLEWFEGTVPVGDGQVSVQFKDGCFEVYTDKDGGVLVCNNVKYPLIKGQTQRVEII